jgi:1-acyl-sn-glycerol-3-phosphate acyltransferase
MMSAAIPTCRRLWRTPLIILWLGVGAVMTAAVAIGTGLAAEKTRHYRPRLTRFWMRGLIAILPLRIHCHGKPTEQTSLLVSNHISWLDIVVIGAQAPVHFLSKAEVRQWPIVGWLANAAGTLFIQRGQATGQSLYEQLCNALQQGDNVVIFAEGTTTEGDHIRPFHGRLLGCAIETSAPVQPVALAYRQGGKRDVIAPFVNDDEFSSHLLRLLGSPPIDVEIHFLPLVHCQNLSRNQLAREVRSAVVQTLGVTNEGSARRPATVRSCERENAITCGMNARKSASNPA